MPAELNPGLQHLSLTATSITRLGSSQFFDYTQLRKLDMSGNLIAVVQEHSLREQASLRTLNLSMNTLTELTRNSLTGLRSLEHLDLSHNQLTRLGTGLFSPLSALVSLRLDHNLLQVLSSDTFASLSSLASLSLASNPLHPGVWMVRGSSLVETLSVLPTLTSLDLEDTGLQDLPSLHFLPNLEKLELGSNPLGVLLPTSLPGLERLQLLSLSNTSLASIPTLALSSLAALQHLDLSSNPLLSLGPGTLPSLPSLLSLHLSHCPHLSLLHTPSLPLLQTLSISHLPTLQAWTSAPLPSLLHLNLEHSAPSSLPSTSLLPALSSLHMSGRAWQCSCPLLPWQLLLLSLPPSQRDSPSCSSGSSLLATDLAKCSPSRHSPSLVLGLSIGVLLLLALLGAFTFHYRDRAALLVARLRGCRTKEEGVAYQRQASHQSEDYWLSLARRAQAQPEGVVPVTEL